MNIITKEGTMATRTPVTGPALEQRMKALQRANEIRSRRAVMKQDLKARRVDVRELLEDPPDWLQSAKVFTVLLSAPKVGRVKATKYLRRAQLSPTRPIRALSPRQRAELVAMLPRTTIRGSD